MTLLSERAKNRTEALLLFKRLIGSFRDVFTSYDLRAIDDTFSSLLETKKQDLQINDLPSLRAKVDIVELIEKTVKLKRIGGKLKGLCPFHNERTPSFVVDEMRKRFKCFGCNKSGTVFDFVMELEGLTFIQAVERLKRL